MVELWKKYQDVSEHQLLQIQANALRYAAYIIKNAHNLRQLLEQEANEILQNEELNK